MTLIIPPDPFASPSTWENWRKFVEQTLTTHDAAIAALQTPPPPPPPPVLILNRDLSTADLSQYTHRDYGLGGADVGDNTKGGGLLNYHANVAGRRAAGLTVTPTANIGVAGSDGVYLWDPIAPWGQQGQEWWLRTSFYFPSAASVALLLPGEAPYQPTTGDWNWFLELHKDKTTGASETTFDICTDYPTGSSPGLNPRLRMRLVQNESSPTAVYVNALGQVTPGQVSGFATPGPALVYDKWREFLLHMKLHPVSGIVEWFLDGQLMYSNLNVPTLFTHADGTVSQVSLTVANYRLHATWPATVFIGPLCIAASKAAALAAF
jgi:hypothetical protein